MKLKIYEDIINCQTNGFNIEPVGVQYEKQLEMKICFDYWLGSHNHYEDWLEEVLRHNKQVFLFNLKREGEINEEWNK